MRILMVIDRYVPLLGGAENQLRQLVRQLRSSGPGCEVLVLTRRWTADLLKKDRVDDVPVYRVGLPGQGSLATLSYVFGLFLFVVFHRNAFDIIHTHGAAQLGALGCVLAKIVRKSNVAKVASADRIPMLEESLLGRVILFIFKQSNAVICLSREIHKQFQRLKIPEERIKHIKNAVDANRFHPLPEAERQSLRERKGFKPDEFVVLFCGNFRPIKGLDVLIAAWPRVVKDFPHARLIVLGHESFIPGSVKQAMQKKIEEEKIPHIYFEGETLAPELYYGMVDILAMPSRQEGFPNVLMEAMASGLASVASDTCGINELIIPDETGVLVPLENPAELAAAIIALLINPSERLHLGQRARNQVIQNLAFEQIAKQYFLVYTELLANNQVI